MNIEFKKHFEIVAQNDDICVDERIDISILYNTKSLNAFYKVKVTDYHHNSRVYEDMILSAEDVKIRRKIANILNNEVFNGCDHYFTLAPVLNTDQLIFNIQFLNWNLKEDEYIYTEF